MQALVSKVLTWSVVDGPGNRLTLFLQGCNFACAVCHNPHTIGVCDHCGECVGVCEPAALRLVDGRVVFDPAPCTRCDACLEICPIQANPMVRSMSVDDVVALARRNAAFLTGITVSGGEATTQPDFLIELFTAVKADPVLRRLTCLIDSNGHLDTAGWARLLPVTDGVMLDVKAFDPDLHRSLTGQGNELVLASARLLRAAGKLTELRFVIIPGRTDTPAELDAQIALCTELGFDVPVRLNAFQHHGVRGVALTWPKATREGVETIAQQLCDAGVQSVSTPAVWL